MDILRIAVLSIVVPMVLSGETFVSVANLARLAEYLDHVFDDMKNLPDLTDERKTLTARMEVSADHWVKMEQKAARKWTTGRYSYVGHPLAALNLINIFYKMLNDTRGDWVPESVEIRRLLPDTSDRRGAIHGLVRLQDTYKLDTAQMAAGVIATVPAGHAMKASDCLDVAKVWMSANHDMALSWFEVLRNHPKVTEEQLAEMGSEMKKVHKTSWGEALNKPVNADIIRAQYEALCRGEDLLNTILVNKNLLCVYRQGLLPYVQYKEEIHSFDPRISVFYDVITDKDADVLKTKAYTMLTPARVGKENKYSKTRISKIAWVGDTDASVEKVSRRVEDATGLAVQFRPGGNSDAEHFQVVNYGIGGQYEPHVDFFGLDAPDAAHWPEHLKGSGDRLATFMLYLSEVSAGGATVFPKIGVSIPPVKNGAAFWYNYPRSHQIGDKLTLHAGCPVLLGQKWVANKWLMDAGQIFKRPCGLNIEDIDPVFKS